MIMGQAAGTAMGDTPAHDHDDLAELGHRWSLMIMVAATDRGDGGLGGGDR